MDPNVISAPAVSVILPVYNGGVYIAGAVESILTQTFKDFELIIINDGSSDNTLDILNTFLYDKRVMIITRENKGLIYSLNEGIGMARGKFIARMDADDYSYPNRLSMQVSLMDKDELDICGGHYLIIGKDDKFLAGVFLPTDLSAFRLYLSVMPPFAHGSVIFRKQFWIENELKYGSVYKEAEDFSLWQEFYFKGARFGNVNEVIFKYRDHPASFSYSKMKAMRTEVKLLRRRFVRTSGIDYRKLYHDMSRREELSSQEREFLLLSSYLYLTEKKDFTFFRLLRRSGIDVIIKVLFKILSGRI